MKYIIALAFLISSYAHAFTQFNSPEEAGQFFTACNTMVNEISFWALDNDGYTLLFCYGIDQSGKAKCSRMPSNYIAIKLPKNLQEDLTQLGIGGYYMIITSEHALAPGKAETTVNAVWVASLEGQRGDDEGDTPTGCDDTTSQRIEQTSLENSVGSGGFGGFLRDTLGSFLGTESTTKPAENMSEGDGNAPPSE